VSTENPTPHDAAGAAESGAQADRPAAEARAAEIREEIAITDQRRAEEDEAKAEEARKAAEEAEAEKEAALAAAEERRKAAVAEAERAREQAGTAGQGATGTSRQGLAGEPAAVAASGTGSEDIRVKAEELANRPEVQIGAAFAGMFVFAQILKKLGG
jgi:hypothetical protein